jgi:hypothetical protein
MNTKVEDLLAEQMRIEAQAATWRPELLHGALRRYRNRRLRHKAALPALAVGVAGAVAASVAVGIPGRTAPAVHPQARTVANIIGRAQSAMAAADTDVLQVRTHLASGWSYTLWFEVRPVVRLRIDVQSASVLPRDVFADGSRILTLDYQSRTWWQVRLPVRARGRRVTLMVPGEAMVALLSVGSGLGGGLVLPTPQNLRRELRDGKFRLVGTQTIDRTRVLRLQGARRSDHGLTIWVNAASYLPVRSSVLIREQTGSRLGWTRLTSLLTWLPGTSANLAALKPIVPVGFEHRSPRCPCG